jgi:hypothetical protein
MRQPRHPNIVGVSNRNAAWRTLKVLEVLVVLSALTRLSG